VGDAIQRQSAIGRRGRKEARERGGGRYGGVGWVLVGAREEGLDRMKVGVMVVTVVVYPLDKQEEGRGQRGVWTG